MRGQTFTGKPCPKEHTKRYTKSKDCVLCAIDRVQRYRKRNPLKARKAQWKADFKRRGKGVAPADPTRPEPQQCECCGRKSKRHLHLDHDHSTGAFRGWLCTSCNLGIGSLGDTATGIQNALTYLTITP